MEKKMQATIIGVILGRYRDNGKAFWEQLWGFAPRQVDVALVLPTACKL